MTDASLVQQVQQRLPADAAARTQALDPARSFIVQAPAGSGKTELLIQRYLVLLAQVEAPEEIVALTFTRKAAGEMRARVLEALAAAESDVPPAQPHKHITWALARAARAAQLRRRSGRETPSEVLVDTPVSESSDGGDAVGISDAPLLQTPARLQILTLDSLCALLVRRMPLLSRLGGMPRVEDDATPLYREAARATLALLDDGEADQATAVATVLTHLDNRSGAVEELLASMLARRDQWLRHVVDVAGADPHTDRARLEAALAAVRRAACDAARERLAPLAGDLLPLLRWAAANLAPDSGSPLLACLDLAELPQDDDSDAVAAWRGLVEFLLTTGDSLRKRVTAAEGFPPPSKATDAAVKRRLEQAKDDFAALIERCDRVPDLVESLARLRSLPPPRYDDGQWEVLAAVVQVLRLAAAQLELVFAARGACDFAAVAQGACAALGTPQAPSDLLLSLDARIRHLLVDEFQDTSVAQFDLLTRLTAGWSDGDGRTLFLVGDPMQSIYRFREAEVGLFLRARHAGIGGLRPVPLQLSTNFRSTAGVVGWTNQAFAQVLPATEDIARGAVPFVRASAWDESEVDPAAVQVHAFIDATPDDEAQRVQALVQRARAADPRASIAILVRGRTHLAAIVPMLRDAGVPLRAVDIEPLRERPIVLDLLALTRALRHPADRIAWLAVLRAPWCGLTLADLDALAGAAPRRPIWSLLNDSLAQVAHGDECRPALSADGRARVQGLVDALAPALADARRATLRDTVEGAWLRLGGADCVRSPRDLDDARAYLELLGAVEMASDLAELDELDRRMDQLFAAPDPHDEAAGPAVEVMTIHKAKGLEFDVVIVPGLHRKPRANERQLLAWTELADAPAGAGLVLGTVPAAGADSDAVHAWIGARERERQRLEGGRLLYVAATRARRALHLLGCVRSAERKAGRVLLAPVADVLLAPLWPAVQAQFEAVFAQTQGITTAPVSDSPSAAEAGLDRRTWRLPLAPPLAADDARLGALAWRAALPAVGRRDPPPAFSWAGETVRLVGTVVHRWLQHIAGDLPAWDAARLASQREAIARELAAVGVPAAERDAARDRVLAALQATLGDPRGRWLLAPREPAAQAASELRLTGLDRSGSSRTLVDIAIDRSFIDAGVRWVIDYKTGSHEGAGVDDFLDAEVERYRPQLERYARLARALGPQPVRCALYFPLLGGWREWAPQAGAADATDAT